MYSGLLLIFYPAW